MSSSASVLAQRIRESTGLATRTVDDDLAKCLEVRAHRGTAACGLALLRAAPLLRPRPSPASSTAIPLTP